MRFLNSKLCIIFPNIIINSSSEEPEEPKEEGISITVEPAPNTPGWSKVIRKDSNGVIVEEGYIPNHRVPDYISRGSATNPISVDDSDSSVSSPVQDIEDSSNPVEDTQGSASNPIPVEDSEDSASNSENEEAKKSKNSSLNDGNSKGGGGGLNTSDKDLSSSSNEPNVGNQESNGNNASIIIKKLLAILGSIIGGLSDFFDNIF